MGCVVVVVVVPVARFDSELAQALEEAENERDQKDKALQENTALGTEIYTLRRNLQVRVGNLEGIQPGNGGDSASRSRHLVLDLFFTQTFQHGKTPTARPFLTSTLGRTNDLNKAANPQRIKAII